MEIPQEVFTSIARWKYVLRLSKAVLEGKKKLCEKLSNGEEINKKIIQANRRWKLSWYRRRESKAPYVFYFYCTFSFIWWIDGKMGAGV